MLATVENQYGAITVDLVIQEFDQWTNPENPTFAPTSICWYDQDFDNSSGN